MLADSLLTMVRNFLPVTSVLLGIPRHVLRLTVIAAPMRPPSFQARPAPPARHLAEWGVGSSDRADHLGTVRADASYS